MNTNPSGQPADQSVSWENLVRFVRQLSHDLRNDLNAAELQSAFIGELAGENTELKEEVKRLREMVLKLAVTLQGISASLSQVTAHKIPYRVSEFLEDISTKLAKDFPAENASVKWEVKAGEEMFDVDPQLLQQAFMELFRNALQHERAQGPISASATIDRGQLLFTLREPKAAGFNVSTDQWGHEPLGKVRQGHYGLGLHRARIIFEAHQGVLSAKYDSAASELVTTVNLPVSGVGK